MWVFALTAITALCPVRMNMLETTGSLTQKSSQGMTINGSISK